MRLTQCPQTTGIRLLLCTDHIRHQTRTVTVIRHHHLRTACLFQLLKLRTYLARLYPVTPYLHLLIRTPHKRQLTAAQPAHQVATAIHPLTFILHKTRRALPRQVHIPLTHARAANIQFSHTVHRTRLACGPQYPQRTARYRHTNGHIHLFAHRRQLILRRHREHTRAHHRLRRTVFVHKHRLR